VSASDDQDNRGEMTIREAIREIEIPEADVARIREELRHATWERLADSDPHAICLAVRYGPDNRELDFRVVGCSCGWPIPRGIENPDDALSHHVAASRAMSGRTSRPTPPPEIHHSTSIEGPER